VLAKSRRGERGHSKANENQRGESRISFVRSIFIPDRAQPNRVRRRSEHLPAQPLSELHGALPNTDPNSANNQDVSTTARDANRPGYVQNYNVTIQYQLPGSTVLDGCDAVVQNEIVGAVRTFHLVDV
jgi:hypothetical protein